MKKEKISDYQKAVEKMERETARAVAQVDNLEKLYLEMRAKSQKVAR